MASTLLYPDKDTIDTVEYTERNGMFIGPATEQILMDEAFQDAPNRDGLERLVADTARKFHKHIYPAGGGRESFEDIYEEAKVLFVKAWKSYRNDKYGHNNFGPAKLITWVRNRIWWGLLDIHRSKTSKNQRKIHEPLSPDIPDHVPSFDLDRFCFELSDDAALVVRLCVEESPDSSRWAPTKRRHWVIRHLIDLGWCSERILACFKEIREALGEGQKP
ncbi:MAG: hypothetical protein KGL39_00785 [Patescibacteria group bacterium]|nr:hypothetical protein [Patescibacteria group bacterium]